MATRVIYKYPIMPDHIGPIDYQMHKGAFVLAVMMQRGEPHIWVEVDVSKPLEMRKFSIVGTGHPIPDELVTYHGSVVDGPHVWHVYEWSRA